MAQEQTSLNASSAWTSGNRVMLYGGVASPLGNFAAPPNAPTLNLTNLTQLVTVSNPYPANAQLGFTLGVANMFKITPEISILASLDASYNPYNVAESNRVFAAAAEPVVGALRLLGGSFTVSTAGGAYINGSLLLGARYDYQVAPLFSVYGTAQVGLVGSFAPAQEVNTTLSIVQPLLGINARTDISTVSNAASAFPFAYALGAGAMIADKICIGVRWLGATPVFTATTKTRVNTMGLQNVVPIGTLMPLDRTENYNVPLGVLQTTVGFIF
jgi:opacity protein-like surface antigen